jgi:DNA-binding IclR family transcriptional regulator
MSALRNAAAVLRLFSSGHPDLGVVEAAAALQLPKSTTSRLLKMMAEEGLLEVIRTSRRYRPGPVVAVAARVYRAGSALIPAIEALVADVVGTCGYTGYVSMRAGRDIFAIKMCTGRQALQVVTPIGQTYPAYASAVGRALLARLSDDEIRSLYADHGFDCPAPAAPADMAALLARIAEVRSAGIAYADDECNRGVGSIAVAVLDPSEGEAAAACLSFSLSLVTPADRARMSAQLLAGAARIGAQFGDEVWLQRATPERRVA